MLKKKRIFSFLLAALMFCFTGAAIPGLAAETASSLSFAEFGIAAYEDGWLYSYGGKGQTNSDGVRMSDCAGLLYAYFSDRGMEKGCWGGATGQVTHNCVFSGDLDEGIPRIHGLALTAPDYYEPGSGIYGHIGIYVGSGMAVDNSTYGVNMRYQNIADNGSWNAWHVFDNGLQYPSNGWYAMNGAMYHYTNYQYDVNTEVDGYTLGVDGVASGPDGKPIPVDSSMGNSGYVSASTVASYLSSIGYDGEDNTHDLIYGGGNGGSSSDYNGLITGSGVRLRKEPNTSSAIVTTFSKNTGVNILAEVEGETVTAGTLTSTAWYQVERGSYSGYVSALYARRTEDNNTTPGEAVKAPSITASNGYVTLTTATENAEIYYTTDGTTPTSSSDLYVSPLYYTGCTYRAIAVTESGTSPVTTASVFSNNAVFTDVLDNQWFFNTVDSALSMGLFGGTSPSTFSPKNVITRGQFVLVLANLDGVSLSAYDRASAFTDVPTGGTYTKAINWAAEMGYVGGFGDNTFRPSEPVTRQQMCKILAGYAGLSRSSQNSLFADDSKISGWAKDAVYACRESGIINGKSNNLFDPQGTALRAEAAKVFVAFSNL